jgi:hypothetical protein
MIASEIEVAGPPNTPAMIRAAIIEPSPVASPPSAVPAASPIIATSSTRRRSKRSRNREPTRPAANAAAV